MGNTYKPDKWVLVKVNSAEPHYRVLAGWYGGYLGSDYWRINSGVTHVEIEEGLIKIFGSTGSCYVVYEENYGLTSTTSGVLSSWNKKQEGILELLTLPEDLENFEWV